METLFNTILSSTSAELTPQGMLLTLLAAVIYGLVIALTYYNTRSAENCSKSMSVTLTMLPAILSVIILFVGSNIARAFSLAGTLSIIRFRSAPGDPEDICFIFFDIAAGLACGVGLLGYGGLFVLILCLVLILLKNFDIFRRKKLKKQLRITVPENLCFENAFEEILKEHTCSHTLTRIKTTDLGALYEIWYNIIIDKTLNQKEFLDEIRCRNGNLTIILSDAPDI